MSTITEEKNSINVIDEFDYSTQNETYNENFREWRKRRGNSYSFDFKKDPRERVYIDGRGFVERSCETAEKKVLVQIFHTLGYAALMYIVFDDVISKLLIYALEFLGLDIHTSFSGSTVYGGCHEVVLTLIIFDIIKMAFPLFYLHFKFKVPKKAELMGSMNNPSALVGAIAAAFMVCVVTTIPSAYSMEVREVVAFFGASQADVSIWNQFEFIIYSVFDILLLPILKQLLFCGAAFTVLRQFGDMFAILITSLTAAVLTQDFRTMPAVFLITFVGCCGMLASGSVFTAFAANIIYKMYELTLSLIETDTSDNMPMIRNLFMAAIVLLGTAGLIYFRFSMKKTKLRLAHYSSPVSFGKRMVYATRTFPFSAVAILCVTYALIKAVM